MVCLRRLLPICAVAVFPSLSGCAGPPIAAPLDGEPACANFSAGRTTMEGGLKHPVRLRVLDGATPVFRALILGRPRKEQEHGVRTYISDSNETYTVEWAECQNERAPRTLEAAARDHARKAKEGAAAHEEGTAYDCGEAKVYKTEKIAVRRGDAASHVVHFAAPPSMACWTAEAPPLPPGTPAIADGGAANTEASNADGGEPARIPDGGSTVADAGGDAGGDHDASAPRTTAGDKGPKGKPASP